MKKRLDSDDIAWIAWIGLHVIALIWATYVLIDNINRVGFFDCKVC
jgi:hypothetical protein